VRLVEQLEDPLDVAERVAEDEVVGAAQVGLLPIVLPGLVAIRQREDAEVHRAHVERANLRLGNQRRGEPLLDRHVEAAAGRHVDDGVGRLLDPR